MLDIHALGQPGVGAQVLGQVAVEAGQQDAEALAAQPPRLLDGHGRLAGAGAAGDRHAAALAERVEQVVLLLAQAGDDFGVGLGLAGQGQAQLDAGGEQVHQRLDDGLARLAEAGAAPAVVGQHAVHPAVNVVQVVVVEDDVARGVEAQVAGGLAVGEGDGVAHGQVAQVPGGEVLHLVEQAVHVVAGLDEGVLLEPRAVGEPLVADAVVLDAPALDFDEQQAFGGVGDDEVGLAVLRASAAVARLPGHAMEDGVVAREGVAEALVEAALRRALGLQSDSVGIHARHISSV